MPDHRSPMAAFEEKVKMQECKVNDLVEKVKMLEYKVSDLEENKKMLEHKKPSAAAWYSIATPELKDEDNDKNLFVLIAGLPGSGKSSGLAKAMTNYEGGE